MNINASRSNWHIILYPGLWAHQTNVKTATGFSPFQLVHGVESVTLMGCEIPSLNIEIHVLPIKPRGFSEGELVLVYDQEKEPLGEGKFKYM